MLENPEILQRLANETGAEVVCAIGNRFVLYKPNPKEPVIVLTGTKKSKK